MKNSKYVFMAIGLFIGLALGYLLFNESNEHLSETDNEVHEGETLHREDEETVVDLSEKEIVELGIRIESAEPGNIELSTTLSGEISIDPVWVSHLKPRYPGIVKEIRINLGDFVNKGDTLAIIEANESLVEFPLLSSVKGTVINIHMSPGEIKGNDEHAIEVANLNHVWAVMTIYQKDLRQIRVGQKAIVYDKLSGIEHSGKINFISPIVNEITRTTNARIELSNKKGEWLPGMFINADLVTGSERASIIVNKNALQTFEGSSVVFVKEQHGFRPQPVSIGVTNNKYAQIITGLEKGQEYVSKGAFTIKAELLKESFGGGHAH
jgi:membrane fusion protein, heavy metal efflux system